MNEYKPEQLRKIDAATMKAMGYTWQTPEFNPTVSYGDWGQIEVWMVENFDFNKAVHYINEREGLARQYVENPMKRPLIFNGEHSPLWIRCLAFLLAMGVDVHKVLAE